MYCQMCGFKIDNDSKKCPYCNTIIKEEIKDYVIKNFCPKCGEQIKTTNGKCIKCDSNIDKETIVEMPINMAYQTESKFDDIIKDRDNPIPIKAQVVLKEIKKTKPLFIMMIIAIVMIVSLIFYTVLKITYKAYDVIDVPIPTYVDYENNLSLADGVYIEGKYYFDFTPSLTRLYLFDSNNGAHVITFNVYEGDYDKLVNRGTNIYLYSLKVNTYYLIEIEVLSGDPSNIFLSYETK